MGDQRKKARRRDKKAPKIVTAHDVLSIDETKSLARENRGRVLDPNDPEHREDLRRLYGQMGNEVEKRERDGGMPTGRRVAVFIPWPENPEGEKSS